ncbi:MAG: hypothetical protein ABSB81_11540 [Halobacteriota archaeon]|jgi:hypothetical protein
MKVGDRATVSVSKKTHAEFERYRAILSAERGKVQTQEDVIKEFLKGRLPAEHKNEDEECDDVYEDYVN